ncbi:acyl carrier protein [Streptomyces prasinus]
MDISVPGGPTVRENGVSITPTAPAVVPTAPVADVVPVLADVLLLKPEKIDPRQSFRSLGLDSLRAAEFVAAVNRVYGTRQRGGVLYEHPSPAALAAHIARITGPRPAPMDVEAVLDAVRDDLLTVDEALALLSRRG